MRTVEIEYLFSAALIRVMNCLCESAVESLFKAVCQCCMSRFVLTLRIYIPRFGLSIPRFGFSIPSLGIELSLYFHMF